MTKKLDYNQHGFENVDVSDPNTISKLQDFLKTSISNVREFTSGALNKVCHLTGKNRDFVIKISPEWNNRGLDRERWCYELVQRMTKLRIAKLFGYQNANNDIFPGHEILAMEYIPGQNLTHVDMTRRSINIFISHILEQIHSIKGIEGYGWLNNSFSGEHHDWHAFIKDLDNIDAVIESGLIPLSNIELVMEHLLDEAPSDFETSFLFGDLNKSNLILAEEKRDLVVPVDFQNCFVGDPLYDIGIALFFNPEINRYLDEYLPDKSTAIRKRVILYALRHTLSVLGHRIIVKKHKSIKLAIDRFEKLRADYLSLS